MNLSIDKNIPVDLFRELAMPNADAVSCSADKLSTLLYWPTVY